MTKRKATAEHKPAGRPSTYTTEIGQEICRRISAGESLRTICLHAAMPARETVLGWVRTHPDFHTRHAHAREWQGHYLVDEAIDNIRFADSPEKLAKARLFFDAAKWAASKLAPKSYGDHLEDPLLAQPQGGDTAGPSDIVLARQLMYFVHRVMARQSNGAAAPNGADPGPSSPSNGHQTRH